MMGFHFPLIMSWVNSNGHVIFFLIFIDPLRSAFPFFAVRGALKMQPISAPKEVEAPISDMDVLEQDDSRRVLSPDARVAVPVLITDCSTCCPFCRAESDLQAGRTHLEIQERLQETDGSVPRRSTRFRLAKRQRDKEMSEGTRCGRSAGRIAICGALPHLMPIRRTLSTPAVNEARQPIHTSRSLPADRPVAREAVSSCPAAPALIGCTHQHQFKRRAALEAAKNRRRLVLPLFLLPNAFALGFQEELRPCVPKPSGLPEWSNGRSSAEREDVRVRT